MPFFTGFSKLFGIFKILSKKEKILFFVFFAAFLISLFWLGNNIYIKNTKIAPGYGGIHVEGIIGQPRFINPIYANSDADRDLAQLIFSGLMKYDEKMQIILDLAESYALEDEERTYKFTLKKNVLWEDGFPLTVEDVIFTIKTIQNPEIKSPYRANWTGVEIEKIDDWTIGLKLKKPYSAFLENCTFKIIPKHIWEKIPIENFAFSEVNLRPIGSGPFKIKEVKQIQTNNTIKSITLSRSNSYFGKKAYLAEMKFFFFSTEDDLIKSARYGEIKGFSTSQKSDFGQDWNLISVSMPRYFAIFFNQNKSKTISDVKIRQALNYATDKKEIVEKIFGLDSNSEDVAKTITDSPVLAEIYGINQPAQIYEYNLEKAKQYFQDAGFKDENNDGFLEKTVSNDSFFEFKSDLKIGSSGTEVNELQKCLAKFPEIYPEGEINGYFGKKTEAAVNRFQEKYAKEILEPWGFKTGTGQVSKTTRSKLNEICFDKNQGSTLLSFSLITVDQPQMVKITEILKEQWQRAGIKLEVVKTDLTKLEQDFIRTRNYEMLLFGEILGALPDPFPFWHSSQKKDPGLNLSTYANDKADKIMEDIRKYSDPATQAEKLSSLQEILVKDAPAIFLYKPDYLYFTSAEIKGINSQKILEPSKRFSEIENWYIKTIRVWK